MSDISISVIVPIYNVADYLRECLDSLDRQAVDTMEVIMVNDGSTDGSDVIAKEYSDRNSNFTLINRQNGGLSAARNTGLDAVHGKYIYFIDSDDFLADGALRALYEMAEKNALDQIRFVAYTFEDGTDDYKWLEKGSGSYKYKGDYPGIYDGNEFYRNAMSAKDDTPSCCMIFSRREIIESNHLRFIEGIINEDNLFNFQLTVLCKRIAVYNRPIYYRRLRNGSITLSADYRRKGIRAMCISAKEADVFISQYNSIDMYVAKRQMCIFISALLYNSGLVIESEGNSAEIRDYIRRGRLLLKKYDDKKDKILSLAKVSYPLYKAVRTLERTVKSSGLWRNLYD